MNRKAKIMAVLLGMINPLLSNYTMLRKDILAIFAVIALLGASPLVEVAKCGTYGGGTGEPNDPFRIATAEDLNDIGNHPEDYDKHFIMVNDIDLVGFTGTQFNAIGDFGAPFTGVFNGNTHTIMNFTYQGVALFYNVQGRASSIKNVTMVDADVNYPGGGGIACLVGELKHGQISNCRIINGKVNAENFCGLLVGISRGDSQISNCSASGTCSAMQFAGALVGDTRDRTTITGCFSDANVTIKYDGAGGLVGINSGDVITKCSSAGTVTGQRGEIGGLVGANNSIIEQCYSSAEVLGGNNEGVGGLVGINHGQITKSYALGSVSGVIDVGGLVGNNFAGGSITDCYSSANVTATCCYIGGLVSGNNGTLQRCYSVGTVSGYMRGGLVSHNHGTITTCFWDSQSSDCSVSDGGVGLSTDQMQKRSTFVDAGWDFINVWDIGENQTYPFLRYFLPSNINKDDETNFYDLAILALHWLEDYTPAPPPIIPGQASNPNPPNGATDVSRDANLSWTAGLNTSSHDVYFGTYSPPPFVCNQFDTTFDPGTMTQLTEYFWRIDEVNPSDTTTGPVWSFTTKKIRCFPADTLVWVDGTLVQIAKVMPGQKIGKLDGSLITTSLRQIESIDEHEGTFECYDIVLENGNRISVVDAHRFLLDCGKWVPVQNLRAGSKLESLNGPISISSISKRATPFVGKVYNLKVKDSERYFVGEDGIIVRDF